MIEALVAAVEEQYGAGGRRVMFDALNNLMGEDDKILQAIYDLIKDPQRYSFILAGKFGQKFLNWAIRTSKPFNGYIVFPGGMHDGKQRQHEYCMFKDPNRWMHKACFIDGCFYQGTTRTTCLTRLAVPKTIETFVGYDESVVQPDYLRSLYRCDSDAI